MGPNAGGAHGLNQVGAGEKGDAGLFLPHWRLHSAHDLVDLAMKVVQHLGRLEVFGVQSLPRVHTDPTTLLHGQIAHIDAVFCLDEPGLFVRVADAGQVGANDLELSVEAGVVGGHFKHAQVEEGDGREGATRYEDQGGAIRGSDATAEAGGGEFVSVEGHVGVGHGGGREECSRREDGLEEREEVA